MIAEVQNAVDELEQLISSGQSDEEVIAAAKTHIRRFMEKRQGLLPEIPASRSVHYFFDEDAWQIADIDDRPYEDPVIGRMSHRLANLAHDAVHTGG
jgi:hypothetical protein